MTDKNRDGKSQFLLVVEMTDKNRDGKSQFLLVVPQANKNRDGKSQYNFPPFYSKLLSKQNYYTNISFYT